MDLRLIIYIFLSALVVSILFIGPIYADVEYDLIDVGTLGGDTYGWDLNNLGQVVGQSKDSSGSNQAFISQNGQIYDLGTLGGSWGQAYCINDRGTIIGRSYNQGDVEILNCKWENGSVSEINSLLELSYFANAINNRGQIVAAFDVGGETHGCLLQNRVILDLSTPLAPDFRPYDINNNGQIVGYYYNTSSSDNHAGLWENGTFTDIHPTGYYGSAARAINKYGKIAGYVGTNYFSNSAFLWDSDGNINIGKLHSDGASAWDVNDYDQVVGMSRTSSSTSSDRAFIWDRANGMRNLNLLVPVGSPTLKVALKINNSGQILCQTNDSRNYLLKPIGSNHVGNLEGTVRDGATGDLLEGAQITVTGLAPIPTNIQGEFDFIGLPMGSVDITISKAGYYESTETVIIRKYSTTYLNVMMTSAEGSTDPVVVEVRGMYSSPARKAYYLDGSLINEVFTARIEWNGHTPGTVRWTTPTGVYDDPCSGDTKKHMFDMGTEFGSGGRLRVMAIADGGAAQSMEYTANMEVINPPFDDLNGLLLGVPLANTLKYSSSHSLYFMDEGVASGDISSRIPWFGDYPFKARSLASLDVEVDGQGTGSANVKVDFSGDQTEFAGFTFTPNLNGRIDWSYIQSASSWDCVGSIFLGLSASKEFPVYPFIVTVGPIPVPCYWRGKLAVDLAVGLNVLEWPYAGEWSLNGTVPLGVYAEGMLGVGMADVIAAEGYLGGGAQLEAQYPDEPHLNKLKIFLKGGIRIFVLVYQYENELLEYSWDLIGGEGSAPIDFMILPGIDEFSIMDRDYLENGYAAFEGKPDYDSFNKRGPAALVQETVIQTNVFPQSTPDLVSNGTELQLTWIYDDPIRTGENRTEVVYSIWNGFSWSAPSAIDDDGTADFNPQSSVLPDGNLWTTWENIDEVLSGGALLDEMLSKMEISVDKYDSAGGIWLGSTTLTSNSYLDRSPKIASASNGKTILTWVSNSSNELMGTSTDPNDIYFVIHDGASWGAPAVAASGVPSIVKYSIAYDGTNAIVMFSGDTDNDYSTSNDYELFALTYNGSIWSAVTQITTDSVEDANPIAFYETPGSPAFYWCKEGDIVTATNLGLSDLNTVVDLDGIESGASDFRLAKAGAGQLVLTWPGVGENEVDLWYVLKDGLSGLWNYPQQLTENSEMEYAVSPVLDSSGNLVVAYNQAQMEYETHTMFVGGEEIIIDNVPVPGQRDLYALWHAFEGDLSVESTSITLDPENPLPGQWPTVTALINNIGDVPSSNIDVSFYNGDPDSGGSLIDSVIYAGPLCGGESAEVSIYWYIPDTGIPLELYVVVDPDLEQSDINRTNNKTSKTVLSPDLTLTVIEAQVAGGDGAFVIRVENVGSLPVTSIDLEMRQNDSGGVLLGTEVIPEILPDAFYDVPMSWPGLPDGDLTAFAEVDHNDMVAEFDEENNSRYVNFYYDSGSTRINSWRQY